MGIEPVCGEKIEIYDEKAGRTEVCDLVGILSDVPSNKKYGVKMLYAPCLLYTSSYKSNQGIFRKDIESVSRLTSEGIYHQIDTIFTKPINISLTMANDSLLKDFLEGEEEHLGDRDFIDTMRDYLNTYRDKYGYDSVFLASVKTKNYYYYNGLDRVLQEGDPENVWFYSFLEQDTDYGIQIDNDQVEGAGNEVTVFINCRITDGDGDVMGCLLYTSRCV